MKNIELKTVPPHFENIANGTKTFELRKDDRDFEVGDVLVLRLWLPYSKQYTGNYVKREIIGILRDCPEYGLMPGYCILSIAHVNY